MPWSCCGCQYRPGPSMVTTVTRVFVSPAPATIAYLGLGRGWGVPLLGPLNPANMALGCGFFDMVTRLELSTDIREVTVFGEGSY